MYKVSQQTNINILSFFVSYKMLNPKVSFAIAYVLFTQINQSKLLQLEMIELKVGTDHVSLTQRLFKAVRPKTYKKK